MLFQSTRPMRGATPMRRDALCLVLISIHAPHAGRDVERALALTRELIFQSTRPMRGATANLVRGVVKIHISIHAPHAGRDS